MSAQGDYLRSLMNTVTTFNQTLEAVADAFDLADDDVEPANGGSSDDETGDDEPADEPAIRSRSPAVSFHSARKKKVVKRKARRRY